MLLPHPPRPYARQERGDRGVSTAELAQRLAVSPAHRLWADDPAPRQVLHQAEEPGQVGRIHALLIKREDEVPRRGAERKIAVLHPFGDAAKSDHAADVVVGEKGGDRLVSDL